MMTFTNPRHTTGDGPERAQLEVEAGPSVVFAGEIDDAELRWLYANCVGVASAAYEDYGLTPLEAAVYGKPSAVLLFGGFLDTVVDGETGVFLDTLEAEAVATALASLLNLTSDGRSIVAHSASFDEKAFCTYLLRGVAKEMAARGLGPRSKVIDSERGDDDT